MKELYKNEAVAKATAEMISSWTSNDEKALNASAEKWSQAIFEQMRDEYEMYANDASALAARGYRNLTSEERTFYNALSKFVENPKADASVADSLGALPVTIINDIYKNLTQNHPLLDAVRFQNAGYSTKFVFNAHTAQNAAWGVVTSEITKEITSSFKVVDLTLAKLSCFIVFPLDLIRMGVTFIDNYVRTVITEAMACALETAIVTGTGKNMPIGMDRKVDSEAVVVDGVYAKKSAVAVTDFTPANYGALIADNLLVTDGGIYKSNLASLAIICNPVDYITKIMPATTVLNTAGQYVGNLFPIPTRVIPAIGLSEGDALIGLLDEYALGMSGPKTGAISFSDEYQFLEDCRTLKTITFANGRAYDNSSFALLDISGLEPAYLNVKVVEGAEPSPTGATGETGATGQTGETTGETGVTGSAGQG